MSEREQEHGTETAVCCTCGPRRRKSPKKTKWKREKKNAVSNLFKPYSKRNEYHDAQEEITGIQLDKKSKDESSVASSSLFFFDAVETPLGEDDYPPIFTTGIAHPKPRVTLEDPITLLKHAPNSPISAETAKEEASGIKPPVAINHRQNSERFEEITRRPSLENAQALQDPRVAQAEKGFPGGLTVAELEECQKFLRGLKLLDPGVMNQVYSFRDVEEEPYTICRWLRATKFKADDILQRLAENQAMFEKAQANDFYPNPDETLGAPVSVFLSQYPFLSIGSAKNGCAVNYFVAGKIHPEGILSTTTIDRLEGYFWWSFMWKMKAEVREAQEKDPDFVRMEGINILDLKGLSSSAISSETMEVIKISSKVADFFPETLHCMLILNAPSFFSFSWSIIKKCIDARTAARIQVFSNEAKGLHALEGLIEKDQIPEDYGGGNISIRDAFAKQAANPDLLRQDVQLIHVKRGKKAESSDVWNLTKDEVMTVNVYTRSVSSATIVAQLNGEHVSTGKAECDWKMGDDGKSEPMPHCIQLTKIKGPGMVTIEVQDLDSAESSHKGLSRGYFLVAGDVTKG